MPAEIVLRRTALNAQHRALGARLVDFHGWELPIQYESILKEHHSVRRQCGLFDVSHMGQVFVEGPQALALLQKVNSNDISRIGPGQAIYSHLPNEKGGVVDDVIISCLAKGRYLVVVNAGTTDKDFLWLTRHAKGMEVALENKSDLYGMVAVQGPKAAEVLGLLVPEAAALKRFGVLEKPLFDQPSVISRTGYTGEDGFEVIIPNEVVTRLWENLLTKGRSLGTAACGLGCRDTLRLEAGFLLYGQDIDDEHSSLEAGYDWVVKLEKGEFIGRDILAKQKKDGVSRKLTSLKLRGRGVPRPSAPVHSIGREIGRLTSATFSPTLEAGIGVGYLPKGFKSDGLAVEIHGKPFDVETVASPFYKREKQNAKT